MIEVLDEVRTEVPGEVGTGVPFELGTEVPVVVGTGVPVVYEIVVPVEIGTKVREGRIEVLEKGTGVLEEEGTEAHVELGIRAPVVPIEVPVEMGEVAAEVHEGVALEEVDPQIVYGREDIAGAVEILKTEEKRHYI